MQNLTETHLIQLGAPIDQSATQFKQQFYSDAPYHSLWWLSHNAPQAGSMLFVPDLSVHLIFDMSGLIEVEPFLITTGIQPFTLTLPPGVSLIGLQLAAC
jgi:hypothetical protein